MIGPDDDSYDPAVNSSMLDNFLHEEDEDNDPYDQPDEAPDTDDEDDE